MTTTGNKVPLVDRFMSLAVRMRVEEGNLKIEVIKAMMGALAGMLAAVDEEVMPQWIDVLKETVDKVRVNNFNHQRMGRR